MKKLEFQKIELTMKVGKHTASVICKNKKTAKQRASQAILQVIMVIMSMIVDINIGISPFHVLLTFVNDIESEDIENEWPKYTIC